MAGPYRWRMRKQDDVVYASPPHHFTPTMRERFEIKQSPGKGMGAFATKVIKAGTIIFEEEPLFVIKGPTGLTTEKNVQRAYSDLSPDDKKLFDQCRHDPTHKQGCKCKLGTFHANQFTSGDMLNQTTAMYAYGSKLNHSCSPNSRSLSPFDKTATHHTFKALRDIAAGEEICFCYIHDFEYLTSKERHEVLAKDSATSSFKCRCKRCTAPPKKRMVSDMRRRMLRYLHFWLRQDDIDDPPNELNAPSRDPEMVKNGVYSLLYAILLEVEGVLHGNDAYMAYALTAWHVLNVAYHNGKSERIYSSVVRDMRMWMKKAEGNAKIQYGEEDLMAEAGDMFEAVSLTMKFVRDDGVIEWDGLMKLKERFLKERNFGVFSTYPPGSDLKPPGMPKVPKCPTM